MGGKHLNLVSHSIRQDAKKYMMANMFIERLRKYNEVLTLNEYRMLREQALGGDLDGAKSKLDDILSRRVV